VELQTEGEDPRLGGKGTWGTGAMAKSCYGEFEGAEVGSSTKGRFPANVIMDEEAGKILDGQSGDRPACMSPSKADCEGTIFGGKRTQGNLPMDAGGASRFFYCPKTNKKDRGEGNDHPTVKPTDLMRYLCRLVTPPEGIVLDPFMGSGSTGKGAILEGFKFIGIDREAQYIEIAQRRLAAAEAT